MTSKPDACFKPLSPALLLLCAAVLLQACGWQLRGADMIPEGLETLHVSSRDSHGDLVRELNRALRSAGVTVPESAGEADLSLVILRERSRVQTATISERARVSEQLLTEEAEFMVINRAGERLLPANNVQVERVFEYNENNVLATRDERELIRAEMRRDLVNQILNRLRQLPGLSDAAQT